MELISVHIPKCAGSSFAQILARNYPGGLFMDYDDQPLDPDRPFQKDFAAWKADQTRLNASSFSHAKVIHGHFWAGKYDSIFPGVRKITWLRHPIRRLVSHYYYWQSVADMPHSLHKRMRAEKMSLPEFAEIPELRNILYRTFLRDQSLESFAFIGIQEHFAEDMDRLARMMNWRKRHLPKQNRTEHSDYKAAPLDPDTEKRLRALNAADLEIYEQALQIRARRTPTTFFDRFRRRFVQPFANFTSLQ